MRRDPREDDTILLRPPIPARRGKTGIWIALIAVAACLAAVILFRPRGAAIRTASEAAIAAHVPKHLTVFRYRDDPAIIVLDFPNLHAQGLMLDRVAALTEKAGQPRRRVLDQAELKAALAAAHESIGTYYYGHDYPAAAIIRFFRLADAEGVTLNPSELRLRTLSRRLGWQKPGAIGAMISLSAAGPPHRVTLHERAVILRHELSHGAFFTDAAYRAYVEQFWNAVLTPAERQDFRAFLGQGGYDTTNQTLMMNETQAYLVFTRDPRFFNAAAVGLPRATITALRNGFIAAMPSFWLKRLAFAKPP